MLQTIINYSSVAILASFGLVLAHGLARRMLSFFDDAIENAYQRGFDDGEKSGQYEFGRCDHCGAAVQYMNEKGGWCWACYQQMEDRRLIKKSIARHRRRHHVSVN